MVSPQFSLTQLIPRHPMKNTIFGSAGDGRITEILDVGGRRSSCGRVRLECLKTQDSPLSMLR